jgi:tetratricopeptide (TPR) repeat protein
VDVLHLARRLWRDRLPSRALGYLETHILGANRTEEDVAGWLIPTLYFDYLRNGDARPLKSVFYHNAMDILALAALFNYTAHMLAEPLNGPVEHGVDLVALGKLFEDLGETETAIQVYERSLTHDLPEEVYAGAVRRLSAMQRRREAFDAALDLWREAADRGHIFAYVELAKYYEHRQRDYDLATHWTQAALDLISTPHCPRSIRRRWQGDLDHRLGRLRKKLGKAGRQD